jgi:hypothetical protein
MRPCFIEKGFIEKGFIGRNSMRMRIVVPVLLCALALLGGCAGSAPAKPESRIDPSANIPASKTFGWPPPATNLVSTDIAQRSFDDSIRDSINTNLGRKGYQQVETEPDLYVTYDVTPYEKTKSNPFSVGVGMGSWGGNVGGSVGVGTGGGSRTVQESRITITVVDRKADKEVWQGTMTGSISPGASSNDIGGVVAQAMSDFPPRRP